MSAATVGVRRSDRGRQFRLDHPLKEAARCPVVASLEKTTTNFAIFSDTINLINVKLCMMGKGKTAMRHIYTQLAE